MQENEKGFLLPMIEEEKCVQCGLCERVCRFERSVGKERDAYAYGIKKKKGRRYSQSGGAFALFAEALLEKGGIVYGVAAERANVFYARASGAEGISKFKGSKYVQASVGDVFWNVKKDLEDGKAALFCGTPCHVDGLVSFLGQKNADMKKLITCDLVCHGVPSPRVFRDYYAYLERRFGVIREYDFRKKFSGFWHSHIESFLLKDNRLYVSENYPNLFYSHLELRESCYHCPYASEKRVSDLTIGDFWGIEKADPLYDDGNSISLTLANSKKGRELIKEVRAKAEIREYAFKDCLQPNLQHPTKQPEAYGAFWDSYARHGFEATVKKFCSFNETDYRKDTSLKKCRRAALQLARSVKRRAKKML